MVEFIDPFILLLSFHILPLHCYSNYEQLRSLIIVLVNYVKSEMCRPAASSTYEIRVISESV